LVAAIGLWLLLSPRRKGPAGAPVSLAILPFQNLGADTSADFLRIALPDEIATTLSSIPSLALRPFAATRKYARPDVDPQAAGRELQVGRVLTGHFLREGERLQVTLEVTDTESNQLLWRDTSTVPASDLIGLKEQITGHLRRGLFPLLGASPAASASASSPRNSEAYDLFLRAAAVSRDPEPNKKAISMLERAVALDSGYAPTWNALGKRYYYDGTYADGGSPAIEKARAAHQRAHDLDPGLEEATANLIGLRVESGDVAGALADARDLLRKAPQSARAHFQLAYVLRYTGRNEDSARECDAALSLDAKNPGWRSCALTFAMLQNYDRAMLYVALDGDSRWADLVGSDIAMRQANRPLALERARKGLDEKDPYQAWFVPCLTGSRDPSAEAAVRSQEARMLASRDSEPKYYDAGHLCFCGYPDVALRLLRSAVEGNFLPYPTMDRDPLLAGVRDTPEFAAIRALAIERQKLLETGGPETARR
jgi:TolB-like protein